MSSIPLKGRAFDNFINSLNTPKTRHEYSRLLLDFAKWRKVKTIDQLLKGDPIELKEHITKFLTFLKGKGLSAGTRNIAAASLRHFYSQNDVTLNWDSIRKFVGEDDTKHIDREYSYEEIAKLLDAADLKYKSIILLMVSSAVRIGALHTMRIEDLVKMKGHDIYKVIVYNRTKSAYETFCSPECYKAINEYLNLRQRFGEVLKPSSPLWRNDPDPEDLEQVKNPKPLSYDAIKSKIRALLLRTGVAQHKEGEKRNEAMASHGFRKFAYTVMGKSHMDPEIRELLVGHKIGVRATYLKYSDEDKLEEYKRAISNLTINPANRLRKEVDEYKKQEREIESLKKQVNDMNEAIINLNKLGSQAIEESGLTAAFEELKAQRGSKNPKSVEEIVRENIKQYLKPDEVEKIIKDTSTAAYEVAKRPKRR